MRRDSPHFTPDLAAAFLWGVIQALNRHGALRRHALVGNDYCQERLLSETIIVSNETIPRHHKTRDSNYPGGT